MACAQEPEARMRYCVWYETFFLALLHPGCQPALHPVLRGRFIKCPDHAGA